MVVDEDMRDVVLIVDALFRSIAEKAAESEGVPVEVAIEGAWTLFEGGLLRLVVGDDEHPLGVEPLRGANRAERRAVAKQNRHLVKCRRQMAPAAAFGGRAN